MGACVSCLGLRSQPARGEAEDRSLLYDESGAMQYDSFGEQALNGENDTMEAQRENEALQRVVSKTSNNMVDVFDIGPQDSAASLRQAPSPFAHAGQGARIARYQHLVSKFNIDDNEEEEVRGAEDDSNPVKVDWLSDEDNIEMHQNRPASIKTIERNDGPLIGTFADAAAAMK